MIFLDLIRELEVGVTAAVDELFNAAWKNQTHPQDLLLTDQHGFYSDMLAKPSVREKHHLSPYIIGPDKIGFGESTFYRFIDWYRQSHLLDKATFEKQLAEDEETRKQEELTVQLEQSIYLRFWEADSILKRYYQLSSLASGEPYDWYLKIPYRKQALIRQKIRNRVKNICPDFYALVKSNYISQIRNAIAHSQFYILGRSIGFLNYSDNPAAHAPLEGISFDKWYRIFHTTLLLHNATIGASLRYRELYKKQTLKNGNRINIRIISPLDFSESFYDLGVLRNRDNWIWHKNLSKEDLCQ